MSKALLRYVVGSLTKTYRLVKPNHTARSSTKAAFTFLNGFSLFEVLLVVCILSLVGGVVAPQIIDWRSNMRLKTAAIELRENLILAKTLAAMENVYIFVELAPTEGKYRLTYKNLSGNLIPMKEECLPPDVKIDNAHPKYSVTNNKTGFNSRGGADNCTIVLTNLQKSSKLISISVIGKVEIKN